MNVYSQRLLNESHILEYHSVLKKKKRQTYIYYQEAVQDMPLSRKMPVAELYLKTDTIYLKTIKQNTFCLQKAAILHKRGGLCVT